jgi:hypothetical protein
MRATLQSARLQSSVRLSGLSARLRPSDSMRTDQHPVPASKLPALPCLPLCSGARTSEWTLTRAPSRSMLSEPACMPTTCASVLLFLHPCPRVNSPPRAHAQRHQNVSAAAEKRARWNCRWHPTTAGPMDDCYSLLLAALARAGRAGAHSSIAILHAPGILSRPAPLRAPRFLSASACLASNFYNRSWLDRLWFVTLVTEVSLRLAPCRSPGEPNLPAI